MCQAGRARGHGSQAEPIPGGLQFAKDSWMGGARPTLLARALLRTASFLFVGRARAPKIQLFSQA